MIPTHYIVVHPGPALKLLTGLKDTEYRAWNTCLALAGRDIAIQIPRGRLPTPPELEGAAGKVVGVLAFGTINDEGTRPGVWVLRYEFWERSRWHDGPGGLGVRKYFKPL